VFWSPGSIVQILKLVILCPKLLSSVGGLYIYIRLECRFAPFLCHHNHRLCYFPLHLLVSHDPREQLVPFPHTSLMLFISLFDLLVLGSAIYLYFQKCSELSLLIVVVISQPPQLVGRQKASVLCSADPYKHQFKPAGTLNWNMGYYTSTQHHKSSGPLWNTWFSKHGNRKNTGLELYETCNPT